MNRHDGKRTPPPTASEPEPSGSERRRMGRIVHDDRGSASVEWHDAPDDYERPVLKIEGTGVNAPPPPLSIKEDNTFNPYDRVRDAGAGGPAARPAAGKRDLKKLSEWIKLMREMEERKKKGEED